jgi:effector-binding domain-containing protein
MNVKIEKMTVPARPVLSVRKTTSVENLPAELGRAYQAIMFYLQELGEHPIDEPFAIYYNMDMQALDMEMGFPVASELPGRGEIQSNIIPAGEIVSAVHQGPYENLAATYEAMTAWMQENHCQPSGIVTEFYINDPEYVAPADILTRIEFQLI